MTARRDDHSVIKYFEALIFQLFEGWLADKRLPVKIDVDDKGLDVFCVEVLPADGFMCQTRIEQPASSAGQERGHCRRVLWRNQGDIEFSVVDAVSKSIATPTTADYDYLFLS